jgi:urease gamma subunit
MYDFNSNNMISELEKRGIKYFYVEYEAMPSKIIYIEASDGAVLTAVVKNGTFESILKVNVPSIHDVLNKIVYESIFPLHGMDRISAIYSNVKAENQSEGVLIDKSYDGHVPSDGEYLDDEDDGDDYGYIVYGAEDEPDPDDEIEAD